MIFEFVQTLLLFVLPGFIVAGMDRRLKGAEVLCLSLLISTLLYAGFSLLLHILGIPQAKLLLCGLVFAVAIVSGVLFRPSLKVVLDWRLLAILILAVVLRSALFDLSPYPRVGDSYVHYSYAKSFLSADWYTADIIDNYWTPYTRFPFPGSYRPPLQDFLHSLGMLFNTVDYVSAASMSLLFGVFIIILLYSLSSMLFGAKAGLLASLIASVNFFLISRSLELEPRLMVAFFVLFMVYFAMKGRSFWLYSTLSAAFAYLTHYTSLWFIVSLLVYYAWKNRRNLRVKEMLVPAAVFLLLISPWLARNYLLYGSPIYTTSKYAAIESYAEDYFSLKLPTVMSYLNSLGGGIKGVGMAVAVRLINMVTTYVPPPQKMLQYGLIWSMSNSMVNVVSPLVFIASLFYLKSNFKNVSKSFLFFMIVFNSIIGVVYLGVPQSDGVAVTSLTPLVLVFLAYAAAYLKDAKSVVLAVVVLSVLLQTALLSYDRASYMPNVDAMSWIKANVPQDSTIMSVQAHEINFYTGRRTFFTPYEKFSVIVQTARAYNVTYYVLTPTDLRLRNVSIEKLGGVADLQGEVNGVYVFKFK